MNDNAFYQCKFFIEQCISQNPENQEMVKAYVSLIEQKTKFDIAFFSQSAEVQKNWNDNQAKVNTNWQTTQTDIAKKQLEVNQRNF
ncbi:hypothetical protein [Thiothrix fructosivorans]|jgi:hypothetical protein|uniref:Uncharacterized protein n=1 Tax=Thiothrix fructosivorans TaxID=111770 RepID=A0A8B0SN11_9GAMM|nr:hypothetical protein [Thiothrix fructosivorans]MBO0612069.1 hypothetical protein [Thiothrix fructosivorans]QTX12431.1 hypothetical protein J1836_008945 [Thiothrix fructosivorans]